MKKLLSAKYSEGSYNASLLALRMGMGTLLAYHGYEKIIEFDSEENSSLNFMGMGTALSQILVIIIELLGGVLVAIGLCTRLAAIPVVLWLAFVLFKSFGGDIFDRGEKVTLLLIGFVTLLISGAGQYSVDKIIENKITNT